VEGLGHNEEIKRIETRVDFLQKAYLRCKSFSKSESSNPEEALNSDEDEEGKQETCPEGSSTTAQEHEQLERVFRELEQIYTHLKSGIQTGAFQWIDSLLIKVICPYLAFYFLSIFNCYTSCLLSLDSGWAGGSMDKVVQNILACVWLLQILVIASTTAITIDLDSLPDPTYLLLHASSDHFYTFCHISDASIPYQKS
jgi:hypothetical protein